MKNKVIKLFYTGRFINFVGSAFSEFAIPIYLYQTTKSAFHTGMQWVAIAGSMGAFIGSSLMENFNHKTVFAVATAPTIFSSVFFMLFFKRRT